MKDLNPVFMKEIFFTRELRTSHYEMSRPNTNKNVTDTITFQGSSIWNSVSEDLKKFYSVQGIQTLENYDRWVNPCNYTVCTEFVPNLGYVITNDA